MISILWLRRDLRLHDHAALAAAIAAGKPIQPVFVFDTSILKRFSNPQDRRLTFIAQALCDLNRKLTKLGGELLVFHGETEKILPQLAKQWGGRIFAAEDFEPHTIARDKAVADMADLTLVKDHLIFSPKEILKSDGTPFKVFTPYAKAWRARLSPSDYGGFVAPQQNMFACNIKPQHLHSISLKNGPESVLAQIGYKLVNNGLWLVENAQERLQQFIERKVTRYDLARNILAGEGTSRISPYLRFGLVSIREALRLAMEKGNADTWISELIWREFYAMILYHYPDSATHEWNTRYRGLAWSQDAAKLAAWKEGKTGYPVVDAAMRQLLAEGWMHNRARMIVASFFTKHLQMDWRLGEAHFAEHLMDYEMASNVGGWQWSASTGTDAQPWFRIFNPLLQSEKFDSEGDYIRAYVPELAHIKGEAIHDPSPLERGSYPMPIVDHKAAREKALELFKSHA